ncbi:ABC transporter substrate-binding protein [Leifsonia sp. Root112D2]|uniref:ABC transporter substrate-binding protein n=1 Tax=Leifsonia sp. Root112D2 TaxID=1736426 RepID=UPI0006FD8FEE|nr:extracellular solute-binding protein [Leifsonia sp. Root112D2]KQV06800.1 sugar ABC transporter substrate-binding protein [Leifsonia sp. Root112D2]
MIGIHHVVRSRRRSALTVTALGAATALFALTGCSTGTSTTNGSYGFPEAKQNASSTITVWVDADRQAAAKAFEKANPDTKIKVVSYDGSANGSNSFRTKMQLFDRAGSGWPDVVFSSQNTDAAWASQKSGGKQAFAATLDKGLVPQKTLDGFAAGALNPCTVEGHVYCLRNDLAQAVLWYNKSLMDQFGYSIPKTWEDYEALGAKVASEHPGYIIGTAGDAWTPEVFMWASKCEANNVTGPKAVTVKTDTTQCKRAASLLDTLRENGTVPPVSVFTPEFVKKYTGKVLMMPGPAWYAGAIFNNPQSLNVPAGQLAVAAPLPWKGEDKAATGNVGGGTWFISSHSKNLKAAEKFVQYVTTADAYQVDLAPGYPAYSAAADKWIAKQDASKYFATPLQPIVTAASQIWDGWGYGIFSQEAIWAKTITTGVAGGKTISELLPAWQTAIENQAKVDGYKVN